MLVVIAAMPAVSAGVELFLVPAEVSAAVTLTLAVSRWS